MQISEIFIWLLPPPAGLSAFPSAAFAAGAFSPTGRTASAVAQLELAGGNHQVVRPPGRRRSPPAPRGARRGVTGTRQRLAVDHLEHQPAAPPGTMACSGAPSAHALRSPKSSRTRTNMPGRSLPAACCRAGRGLESARPFWSTMRVHGIEHRRELLARAAHRC
jgi:hypothetical protein